MSYSQGKEEETILAYFAGAPAGRFLDCGSWSGETFSNSRALALAGWGGVCIEPSPAACAKLLELYGNNPAVQVVNAAVSTEAGWAELLDAGGDALSTLCPAQTEKWKDSTFRRLNLWAVSIPQLLHRFRPPFRFVSIDAEGMSLLLLERMPLRWMETECVCVEHDGQAPLARHFCATWGLTECLLTNAENVIYARPKVGGSMSCDR